MDSGSQVMASVMALNEGWVDSDEKVSPIDFEVLDNFKNLRDGVNGGKAAAFMWEKFTSKVCSFLSLLHFDRSDLARLDTQPYLDEVRFIGTVPTPWHSWAVVASPSTLAPSSPLLPILEAFLSNLTQSIRSFDSPQARSSESVEFVKSAFGYPEEDVRAWFDQVSYPQGEVKEIEKAMVEKTLKYVSFSASCCSSSVRLIWLHALGLWKLLECSHSRKEVGN